MKKVLQILFILAVAMVLISCQKSDSDDTTVSNGDTPTSVDDIIQPTPIPDPGGVTDGDFLRSTDFFGSGGNLYKPVSDEAASGQGNLVILLDAQRYPLQFDSCSILKSDGTTAQLQCVDDQPWTQIPFSCFSNGNRQTWRADFKCSSVGAVRVVCRTFFQEVTFTAPGGALGNVCSRFG